MPTRAEHLARVYQDALAAGLDEEGARVAAAIATTEAGYAGAVGDRDRSALGSAGTFQFYFGTPDRPGQGNAFAAAHGLGQQAARDYLSANPHAANAWALGGYLGDAIRQGQARGLHGADLATFAQTVGQRSESPERSGANYRALWSGGGGATTAPSPPSPARPVAPSPAERGPPAITEVLGRLGAGFPFAAGTAEAAELEEEPTPAGGAAVASESDRPPSEFEQPSAFGGTPGTAPPPAAAGAGGTPTGRYGALLEARRKREAELRGEVERLSTPGADETTTSRLQAAQDRAKAARENREKALQAAQSELAQLRTQIQQIEMEVAKESAGPGGTAAKRPRIKARDGSVWEQNADGDWEQVEEIPTGPAATAPRASRSYKVGGVTYSETAPDAASFGALPAGAETPEQMTPYQAASAAASVLTAQIEQGRLNYDQAKSVFDYVTAQQAPVEEGGTLYRPGRQPGSSARQQLGLSVQPYAVTDAAAFFGRPELNRYVHGPYPFGAGPMSPAEYAARQAGGTAAMAPAEERRAGPAPSLGGATEPALTPFDERPGGFSPLSPGPAQGAPAAAFPGFGAPTGGGSDVLAQQQALMADVEKIRETLLAKGFSPQTADRAARLKVGMGPTLAQTPF